MLCRVFLSHYDALLALDDALQVVGAALVVAVLGETVVAILGRRRGRGHRRRECDARIVVRVCNGNVRA